ncbi:hypothetical protein KZ483_05570 [Paenibacillus sp. sptzw28]|uniref:hypothetical protein n=1 Tax=Paenibacillus sp. sptzw28 TaxID=715179 RepID=UPI001C6DD502|nr:hypothetical protein [Paenibacillus sp. sptzw28]QYR22446.1 hypothetical protein KZ483_05570 [Paenibacillus sp. sptzw28]
MIKTNEGKFAYTILTVYLWIGAAAAGYFFEVSFLALNAALFLALAVYICRTGLVRVTLLHGLLFLLISLYWLSCFYAVDREAAVLEAARITNLLPIALLVSALPANRRWDLLKQWAWIGAFLTVLGWVLRLFRNGRLESTIGYANVLAILLAVGIWMGWKAYREKGGRIYLLLVAVQLAGMLQTGSRAVLALFVAGSLWQLARSGRLRDPKVWFYSAAIAILLLIAAGLNGGVLRRLTEWSWNSPEFHLRRIYWFDGFRLLKDVWHTGLGGGGWAVLHPGGYFVKYVHQYYLQAALDAGVWATAIFVALVLASAYGAIKSNEKTAPIPLVTFVFLIHIAFDIDFSFPLCFGYFIMSLCVLEGGKPVIVVGLGKAHGRIILAALCVIVTIGFGWISAGYGIKAIGVRAASNENWNDSTNMLQVSGQMLPWAHSVHFELANSYTAHGNKTGENRYYGLAIREMEQAVRSVPQYTVYQQMMKSLYSFDGMGKK